MGAEGSDRLDHLMHVEIRIDEHDLRRAEKTFRVIADECTQALRLPLAEGTPPWTQETLSEQLTRIQSKRVGLSREIDDLCAELRRRADLVHRANHGGYGPVLDPNVFVEEFLLLAGSKYETVDEAMAELDELLGMHRTAMSSKEAANWTRLIHKELEDPIWRTPAGLAKLSALTSIPLLMRGPDGTSCAPGTPPNHLNDGWITGFDGHDYRIWVPDPRQPPSVGPGEPPVMWSPGPADAPFYGGDSPWAVRGYLPPPPVWSPSLLDEFAIGYLAATGLIKDFPGTEPVGREVYEGLDLDKVTGNVFGINTAPGSTSAIPPQSELLDDEAANRPEGVAGFVAAAAAAGGAIRRLNDGSHAHVQIVLLESEHGERRAEVRWYEIRKATQDLDEIGAEKGDYIVFKRYGQINEKNEIVPQGEPSETYVFSE